MNEKLIKRDEGTPFADFLVENQSEWNEDVNSITTWWLQSLASGVVTAFGVCENGLNYWAWKAACAVRLVRRN